MLPPYRTNHHAQILVDIPRWGTHMCVTCLFSSAKVQPRLRDPVTTRHEPAYLRELLEPEPTIPQSSIYLDCRQVQAVLCGHGDARLELFEEADAFATL